MANYELNVDGQMSEWNEAMFKMIRLHKLQTELNITKLNPLEKSEMANQYNYIVWFSLLNGLYFEGKAKYKTAELKELDEVKDTIEKFIVKCPVHVTSIVMSYGGRKSRDQINEKNWTILKSLLESYETLIKLYNDKHGLSTKNAEDMNGRSILR